VPNLQNTKDAAGKDWINATVKRGSNLV
jgi:hypothetical protein